jgi:hypothetical protein
MPSVRIRYNMRTKHLIMVQAQPLITVFCPLGIWAPTASILHRRRTMTPMPQPPEPEPKPRPLPPPTPMPDPSPLPPPTNPIPQPEPLVDDRWPGKMAEIRK